MPGKHNGSLFSETIENADCLLNEAIELYVAENYKNAVKIVQGSRDQYVSEESLKHYQSCFDNCETVIVENADHCYSTVLTTESVRKEIKKFYGKIKNLGV